MKELMKINDAGNATMSSREIAELTGKQHSNVMVDCRKLDKTYMEMGELRLQLVDYTDKKKEKRPMFLLTKIQTLDLMTGYNTELRIKVNRRWQELELKHQLPQTFSEALMLAAKQAEQIEQQQLQLSQANDTIEQNKSKVVFAETVKGSGNSILIREFAKLLQNRGIKIGQNRLYAWFRDNGYLMQGNEPYQSYMQMGLFEVIERTVGDADSTITVRTTKLTGKGQEYFTNKIINNE
jgi:anti-repressor protein